MIAPNRAPAGSIMTREWHAASRTSPSVTFSTPPGIPIRGRAGLPDRLQGTSSHVAVCQHALRHRGMVHIPDLSTDTGFTDHPEVRGGASLRFYAAAPLVVDDHPAIGCLCPADYRPRELTTARLLAVRLLGDARQRELRRALAVEGRRPAPLSLLAVEGARG